MPLNSVGGSRYRGCTGRTNEGGGGSGIEDAGNGG